MWLTCFLLPGKFGELLFLLFLKLGSRMIVGRLKNRSYGKRVEIPRCRATVSEDTRGRSLGPIFHNSGRSWEGRRNRPDSNRVLTRKPGDRREPSPTTLSRVKEDGMRSSVVGFLVLLLSAAALAADLKVKVLDPQAAAIARAEVSLVRPGDRTIDAGIGFCARQAPLA